MDWIFNFVNIAEKVLAFLGICTITITAAFVLLALRWTKEEDQEDERHSKN
jgi:hypothetical protein